MERTAPFSLAEGPEFRLGAADGPVELQFTAVTHATRLSDGRFVIIDAGNVRVLDDNGEFVRSIGGAGGGPGEFRAPALAAPLGQAGLVVWDRTTGGLSWFDEGGAFEDSSPFVRQSVVALSASADGSLLAVSDESPAPPRRPGIHRQRNTGHFLRIIRDGAVDSLARVPGTEWELRVDEGGMRIRAGWYYPRLRVGLSTAGAWITDGTDWELRRHDLASGSVDRIVRFDAPIEPFTDQHVRELHARALAAAEPQARPDLEALHDELEYPPMLPPIEGILVDGDDRLWVGRLEAPGQALPSGMGRVASRWVVLTNGGAEVLGTVTLPPGRRLLYADHEGALTVTVDELDVPFVEWWIFR
jgi:hypothetical protein